MYNAPAYNPADQIIPGIWLGNRNAALDPNFLRVNGINAVFNCTKDIPFHETVVRRYRVPVDDNLEDSEIRNLELWSFELVYKIALEKKRGPILIHCAAGIQRSAATVAMFLIASYKWTAEKAMTYIKGKRLIAFTPSANFERAIRGFEQSFDKSIRPYLAEQREEAN